MGQMMQMGVEKLDGVMGQMMMYGSWYMDVFVYFCPSNYVSQLCPTKFSEH